MAGDAVWLDILPSMAGFAKDLTSKSSAAALAAGRGAGQSWSKSFESSAGDGGSKKLVRELESAAGKAKKAVDRETVAISRARASQRDAAAKVVEAEDRLVKARESGDAAKVEAAELRLAAARDRNESASAKVEQSEESLKAAKREHRTVTEQLEDAEKDLGEQTEETSENARDSAAAWETVKDTTKKAAVGVLAVAAAVGTAGAALFSVGSTFHDVSSTIQVGTGATGAALDDLVDSSQNIATSIPVDFQTAADAVSILNTATGETGDGLEHLSEQVLSSSRLLGEDGVANAEAYGQALNQWQMDADQGATALDGLFKVTQDYGVGLGDVIGQLNTYGSVLNNAGFTMEQSADLFGRLGQSGLDVSRVMPGLNKAFRDWASEGLDAQDMLAQTVGQIAETGSAQEALAIATETFGAEGAQRLVTAVRNGSFALDDLGAAMSDTGGLIAATEEDTLSFSDQWLMFKNEVLTELEPVATRVFDGITTAMEWIRDTGVPVVKEYGAQFTETLGPALDDAGTFVTDTLIPGFQDFTGWLEQNQAWLLPIAAGVGAMVLAWQGYQLAMTIARTATAAYTVVQTALNVVLNANPIGIVVLALVGLTAAFVTAYNKSETFRNIVDAAWAGVKDAALSAWEWMKSTFQSIKDGLGSVGDWFTARGNDITGAWDSMKTGLRDGWRWVKTHVFSPFKDGVDAVGQAFSTTKDWIAETWDGVKRAAAAPVNFVIETVYTDGIKATWDRIAGAVGLDLALPRVNPIRFADGGVMPGYTPGRDVHQFVSPTGGLLELSGGEPILRPEVGRVLGPSWVNGVNAAARVGGTGGVSTFLGQHQAFENGGFFSSVGSWISDAASAVAGFISDPAGTIGDLITAPVEEVMRSIGGGRLGQMLVELPRSVVSGLVERAQSLASTVGGWFSGGDAPSAGSWVRPSSGPITSRYGPRWGAMHAGIDVAGGGPTYAAAAGLVRDVGWNILSGRTGIGIGLDHGGGTFTYYGHNPSLGAVQVAPGQSVRAGQHIGYQGATGNVTGTHLHFELHRGGWGSAVNPETLGVFDDGGFLMPGSVGMNLGSSPEPVLTDQQWSDIHTLAIGDGSGLGGALSELERLVELLRDAVREGAEEGVEAGFSGGQSDLVSTARMGVG